MVDDQVDWAKGVNFLGITAQSGDCISHGSQIDDSGHSCEILEDDPGWLEGDLNFLGGKFFPVQDVLNIFGLDLELITVPDGTFK